MVQLNSKIHVSTSKLLNNVAAIQSRLNKNVETMAVIKDNAYGHDLIQTARVLQPHVHKFCVARVDEGVTLRNAGITKPILVFECPNEISSPLYSNFNLIASVTDISILDVLKPRTEFHINLDTGMRRLGVLPTEVELLRDSLRHYPKIKCTGVFTHFAKSDDPGNAEVAQQLAKFKEMRAAFDSDLLTHTANTGAIFYYNELDLQFDAVRPGVSLYGYSAGEQEIMDLEAVIEWKSNLMQVKPIKKGEAVSYGWRWVAPTDGFIAAVPTGYAAGLPRVLSGQIQYAIDQQKVPQVGTISMDYSMVFLGDINHPIGTEITILGGSAGNAKEWAEKAHTIPYEITTRLHPSIQRVFVD